MRNGGGAVFPHHDRYSNASGLPVDVRSSQAVQPAVHQSQFAAAYAVPARQNAVSADWSAPSAVLTHAGPSRENVARLFRDLRAALRVTPHQVAAHLVTRSETIAALEAGEFGYLPPWPETARVVMAYTSLAGIDGRPVLAALAEVLQREKNLLLQLPAPAQAVPARPAAVPAVVNGASKSEPPSSGAQPARVGFSPVSQFLKAGAVFAHGAKTIPVGAMLRVRERPQRAFYAVSLPLAVVALLLNTSTLQAAFSHVPRPIAKVAKDVRNYFQVQFAPVREGLRWIEVDDPRQRRSDKLR